jgi:hypothetical protein
MTNFLPSDHPSANTETAQFLFQADGCLFLVEATNQYVVQAIELIAGPDQQPTPGCQLVAVFRDCGTVGIRSDNIVELEYANFLTMVADRKRIATIPGLKQCIAASLNEDDRTILSKVISEEQSDSSSSMLGNVENDEKAWAAGVDNTTKLHTALSNLGFNKQAVRRYIKSLDPNVVKTPLEELIQCGVRVLSS